MTKFRNVLFVYLSHSIFYFSITAMIERTDGLIRMKFDMSILGGCGMIIT